jgi:two-component system, OmpR family, sensor histidine kinase CpxA
MRRIFLRFFFTMLGAMLLAFIVVLGLTFWLMPTPPSEELRNVIRPIAGLIILIRTVPGLICMAVVCYVLARQMARPLERLRTAIRRFAAGELDQRVSPELGRRRDEIGQLARDFDAMAERIALLLSSQQRLLRDISHELRSPLARQQIAIGLLRERITDEKSAATIDRIELEAERLDDLIAELLTLARLDNDSEHDTTSSFDLAELVRSVVADANFEATRRNRRVQLLQCDACSINGTQSVLRRAVDNVVRNAVRHTADGTNVDVTLICDSDAVLRVRDRGPGVPAAALDDIFRPFFRVENARDRNSGGSGIGLAIAHRAVSHHRGRISARNADNGGLEVEILIPPQSDRRPGRDSVH